MFPLSPSLSPLGITSLFCLWVCFFVLVTSLSYFLDSMYEWYHTVFIFLCLVSLSIMSSKSIHVVTKEKFHPLYIWVVFHCVCVSYLLYSFFCWWTRRLFPKENTYKVDSRDVIVAGNFALLAKVFFLYFNLWATREALCIPAVEFN